MASKLITAIFDAKEMISTALQKASKSTEGYQDDVQNLNRTFNLLQGNTELTEQEMEGLRRSFDQLNASTKITDKQLDRARNALSEILGPGKASEEVLNEFEDSMQALGLSTGGAAQTINRMSSELREISATGELSSNQIDQLRNSFFQAAIPAAKLDREVSEVNQELGISAGIAGAASASYRNAGRSLDQMGDHAGDAAKQLGVLSAVAAASSFEFSSLSVNIGPFNVALRNFLIQLPAILTGMGALLAIVTSLASAFLVLGGALGAIVAGGALAFWEEFGGQFEETAEAAEALMGALRDLFVSAMEPLMNDVNMELFIGAINGAANVVNRFAQFFNQMRRDILDTIGMLEGDMEAFFESLHDSFVIVRPVMVDFINFFTTEFPQALRRFSVLTVELADALGPLIAAFGNLFNQLLDFGEVVLSSFGPVIAVAINLLAEFFRMVNSLGDGVLKLLFQSLALVLVFNKAQGIVMTLVGGLSTLTTVITGQAAAGGFLANVYFALGQAMNSLLFSSMSLSAVWTQLRNQMALNTARTMENLGVTWGNVTAKLAALKTNLGLAASYLGLSGAITVATNAAKAFWTVISGGLIPVIAVIIGALLVLWDLFSDQFSILGMLSGLVSGFVDILKGLAKLIATLLIPVINLFLVPWQIWFSLLESIFDIVDSVIGKVAEFLGFGNALKGIGNIFQFILQTLDKFNMIVGFIIDQFNRIPGIDIEGPAIDAAKVRNQIDGETDEPESDDIQTNPNVDLSFEDSLEQNVDVQADPEDREGLKRVVKDAMDEANSLQRRHQGGT